MARFRCTISHRFDTSIPTRYGRRDARFTTLSASLCDSTRRVRSRRKAYHFSSFPSMKIRGKGMTLKITGTKMLQVFKITNTSELGQVLLKHSPAPKTASTSLDAVCIYDAQLSLVCRSRKWVIISCARPHYFNMSVQNRHKVFFSSATKAKPISFFCSAPEMDASAGKSICTVCKRLCNAAHGGKEKRQNAAWSP